MDGGHELVVVAVDRHCDGKGNERLEVLLDVVDGEGEGGGEVEVVDKGDLRAFEPTAKEGLGRSHAWRVDAGATPLDQWWTPG